MASTAASAGDRPRRKRRIYTQLWFVVLVAIAAGIVFGLVAPEQAKKADWLADAFLQLIKTVTGPVIFVTVVIGISSLGNLARAGGLALRALGYFLVMTVIALVLGLLAGNIVAPGSGLDAKPTAESAAKAKESIDDRRRRLGHRRLHHQRPAADQLPAAVRGQQDPPDPGASPSSRRRRSASSPTTSASAWSASSRSPAA